MLYSFNRAPPQQPRPAQSAIPCLDGSRIEKWTHILETNLSDSRFKIQNFIDSTPRGKPLSEQKARAVLLLVQPLL